jgi:hypothetical protein
MKMKQAAIAMLIGFFAAVSVGAAVTGKLGTVKIVGTKKGDYPVVAYSYQITSGQERIKRPVLSFYLKVEHPDTTRSTHYAEYNPSWRWDQAARSKREPEVAANTVRSVRGQTSGSPFFPNYVSADKDKILVLRCELWQDGVLLDEYTSSSAKELEKLGIPPDWYQKKL